MKESSIQLGPDQRPPMPAELHSRLLEAQANAFTLAETNHRLANVIRELKTWEYTNCPSPELLAWAKSHIDGLTLRAQAVLQESMRRHAAASEQLNAAQLESHDYQPWPLPIIGQPTAAEPATRKAKR